ncbi:MAG: AAA family ATPase [Acidimicrobiales bacterium]
MLYVITGVMAAGKSTVAQALAERFTRSVHLRGDMFRRSIVNGRVDMTVDVSPAALDELRLRYEMTASAADRYVAAGFTTVVQDTILGPMLAEVPDLYTSRPLAVIVLSPSAAEVARREAERKKTGYGAFSPQQLDAVLRGQTPRLGLWIDSSYQSPAETVDTILSGTEAALV